MAKKKIINYLIRHAIRNSYKILPEKGAQHFLRAWFKYSLLYQAAKKAAGVKRTNGTTNAIMNQLEKKMKNNIRSSLKIILYQVYLSTDYLVTV